MAGAALLLDAIAAAEPAGCADGSDNVDECVAGRPLPVVRDGEGGRGDAEWGRTPPALHPHKISMQCRPHQMREPQKVKWQALFIVNERVLSIS